MSENKDKIQELREDDIIEDKGFEDPEYSLSDDRRVKVLSPGAMVAKRFFRNRTAMVGLVILLFMFTFSFVGGIVSPYDEDQRFYRVDSMQKEFCSAIKNNEFRYSTAEGQEFSSIVQAKMVLAVQTKQSEFSYGGVDYKLDVLGEDFYAVSIKNGPELGIAYKSVFFPSDESAKLPYNVEKEGLLAYTNGEHRFVADGKSYMIDDDGIVESGGVEIGYISNYIVQSIMSDVFLSRDFKERLIIAINDGIEDFVFEDEQGEEFEYRIEYDAYTNKYTIRQARDTFVYDSYGAPSKEHWLGTDRNGMDMLTRLMYGGRVSLIIGFIVELIANFIGVILGGISGYFGGWVDNLIMRIVDIFYCIPSMPIIIILGAAMDAQMVDPKLRMVYLMLILGFLGWPGVARMIRGQILSLREQEFMTATEATGISISRRIFRHLVPNVIPLLIVSASMGIGGTIITEATLSFLGLGVKFPFASWGNIINDVNNTFVLQNYWFIWIPAGVLLLTTVLAFNLVGDGLRDAFDPRMKR
ncbi:MAG: ABC transporter permease [Clostridiales bacterium]|nr:ABC transporter permease [Clostridiales bacterium]